MWAHSLTRFFLALAGAIVLCVGSASAQDEDPPAQEEPLVDLWSEPSAEELEEPADAPRDEQDGAAGLLGLGQMMRDLGGLVDDPDLEDVGPPPDFTDPDFAFGDAPSLDPDLLTEGENETPEQRMRRLFAELRYAETASEADFIAEEIEATWRAEVDPTVKLLSARALAAATVGDHTLARQLADGAIALSGDRGAEAYVRSAEIALVGDDLARALIDLETAVTIDPNRYDAFLALAAVFERIEASRGAFEAYEAVLALYPENAMAKGRRDTLQREVFGADM